jgi:hypothetical protein
VCRVSDGAALLQAIADSPVGKLWNSREMKAFLNHQSLEETLIKSTFAGMAPSFKKKDKFALNRKILSFFKGEIVAGVEYKNNDTTNLFALIEMSEADFKIVRELFKRENDLSGTKSLYRQHSFQGVELVQTITHHEKGEKSEWMGFYGNTWVYGSSRPWVEKCIVRLKKELPQKAPGIPSFGIWFPDDFFSRKIKLDRQQVNSIDGAAVEQMPDSTASLKAFGLAGIGKLSFRWTINPSYSELELRVRKKGETKGFWTLFSGDPLPIRHSLAYVPENIPAYQVLRLDLFAFWKQLPVMMADLEPGGAARFKMGMDYIALLLRVDLSRDFFANFDTVLSYYSRFEGGESVSLYIWQLRNSLLMRKTLEKLFAENAYLRMMLKNRIEVLNLQDHKVYVIKAPRITPVSPPMAGKNSQEPPKIEFSSTGLAVVDGDLVFGPLDLLRSYIHGSRNNNSAREFYKSPMFTRMIRRVPDNASGYGLMDVSRLIEQGIKIFKTGGLLAEPLTAPKGKVEVAPGSIPVSSPFDNFLKNLKLDKLPAPDFFRSFFGPAVNYFRFNGKELTVKWEFHNPLKN